MTIDKLTRLARLFDEAIALPAGRRAAFLADRVADDVEREELRRLLESDAAARGFLEHGAIELLEPAALAGLFEDAEGVTGTEGPRRLGDYQVQGLLGRGSMGEVYLARQPRTGQLVALKVLRGSWRGRKAVQRFDREMRILGRLQHPGIARILEAGRTDTASGRLPYFAMEYVQGRDVVSHVRERRLDVREEVRLFVALCLAVEHAHERGVIHRDLKPDNVLVTEDGGVKVLDFGVARVTDPDLQLTTGHTSERHIVGTLAYMSPEQAAGEVAVLDRRSDVYALGVMMYEVLAGRLPVDLSGLSMLDATRAVQEQEPIWMQAAADSVPRDLALVVHKALAKEPQRRYPSAATLAADLRRWLAHEPVTARPASTLYSLRKLAGRHRGLAGGVTIAMLTLLAACVVSLSFALRASHARDEALWSTYVANIRAATSAVESHDLVVAAQRLREAPPALRGWEWRHLKSRLDLSERTLAGHATWARTVRFSPDGAELLSTGDDGTLRFWDAETGALRCSVRLPGDVRNVAVFAPSGRACLSGSADGRVELRDVATGAVTRTLQVGGASLAAVAFAAGGARCAAASNDGVISTWDLASRDRFSLEWDGKPLSLALSRDGLVLVVGGVDRRTRDARLTRWDLRTGERIDLCPGEGKLQRLEFAEHDSLLVASFGKVVLLDARTLAERARWSGHEVKALGFGTLAPDGVRLAAVGQDHTVRVWNRETDEVEAVLHGHVEPVVDVDWAPDGRRLATACYDGSIKLWRTDAGAAEATPVAPGYVYTVAFSPDGGVLASGGPSAWSEGELILREAATRRPLARACAPRHVVDLAFAPQGGPLAVGILRAPDSIELLDPLTGELVGALAGPLYRPRLAWSSSGSWLAYGDEDGAVGVCRWPEGDARSLGHHDGAVRALAASSRGTLASAGDDAVIRLWDVTAGAVVASLEGHDGAVNALAFDAPGRRLASAGDDGSVRVWDLQDSGAPLVLRGHARPVLALDFSADGTRLVSAGQDRDLILWEAATGREITHLQGHTWWVHEVAFSPDDRRIASAGKDGVVRVWDTVPFAERPPRAEPEPDRIHDMEAELEAPGAQRRDPARAGGRAAPLR